MDDGLPSSYLERYLAPFRDLIMRDDVVELAINPDGRVWIEYRGVAAMEETGQQLDPAAASNLANTLVGDARARLSERAPVISGKIEYRGRPLRVQVVVPPAVDKGAAISIRLFGAATLADYKPAYLFGTPVSLNERRSKALVKIATLAKTDLDAALKSLVEKRLNLLISGGTSTGKTTFARHLLTHVAKEERLITIEDAFELFPAHPNAVCLLAERTAASQRSTHALLQASLRMRPDRVIVGEIRGPEALTYLEAINTGHGGSVTTIHAETAELAMDRLALMVLQAGTPLTFAEVQTYIRKSIDMIVQLGRIEGRRGVTEVLMVAKNQQLAGIPPTNAETADGAEFGSKAHDQKPLGQTRDQ